MKKHRHAVWVIAASWVLSILMAVENPCQIVAESQMTERQLEEIQELETELSAAEGEYVSEVRLSIASTSAGAKNWLTENGYTVVNQDLKQNQKGNYVYLGYKTTSDVNQAVTDIRAVGMTSGIEMKNYSDLATTYKENIAAMVDDFKSMVKQVRKNAENGSKLAIGAKETINNYYYDLNGEHIPLFDYLTGTSVTNSQIQDIILKADDTIVSSIYNVLAIGTADSGDENFLDRLVFNASLEDQDFYCSDASGRAELYDQAKELMSTLQNYYSGYTDAKARIDGLSDDEKIAYLQDVEKQLPASDEEAEERMAQGIVNDSSFTEASEEINDAALFYQTYTIMEQYTFAEPIADVSKEGVMYANAAEYILACGNPETDADGAIPESEYERLYPLLTVLENNEQLEALKYSGLTSVISTTAMDPNETLQNIESQLETAKQYAIEDGYTDGKLPVFYGVDMDIYEKQIAVTSEAIRQTQVSDVEQAAKQSSFSKTQFKAEKAMYLSIGIASSLLAATVISGFVTSCVAGWGFSISAVFAHASSLAIAAVCEGSVTAAASVAGVTTAAVVSSIVGAAIAAVAVLAIAVVIICAIIAIVAAINKRNAEWEAKKKARTVIPDMILDVENSSLLKYYAVTDNNGNNADVNDGDTRLYQWDALYVSYSPLAGTPLRVSTLENGADGTFIAQTNDLSVPDGYTAVRRMGTTTVANLTATDRNPSFNISLYFKQDDSGTAYDPGEIGGKYITAICMFSGTNEEAAKAQVREKNGYQLIDYNLTPNGSSATYIGIKTSNTLDGKGAPAVRDIRVAVGASSSSVAFGESNGTAITYANAFTDTVNTKNKTKYVTCNGWTIVYSTNKASGEPILADSLAVGSVLHTEEEGYVPVSSLSGGSCFDLTMKAADGSSSLWVSDPIYMYYKYETNVYDETEYVSGFATVYGGSANGDAFAKMGFELTDAIGTDNLWTSYDPKEHLTTMEDGKPIWLLYSRTHNHYRAITDVTMYHGSTASASVPAMINIGNQAYASCQAYNYLNGKERSFNSTNAYITLAGAEHSCYGSNRIETTMYQNDLFLWTWWRAVGLYVSGPGCGDPLTVEDIVFSKQLDSGTFLTVDGNTFDPSGLSEFRGVTDAADIGTSEDQPETFSLDWSNPRDGYEFVDTTFTNYHYMWIRGSLRTRSSDQIYVSSVYVDYENADSAGSANYVVDMSLLTLLSKGGYGEIKYQDIVNTASNQALTDGNGTHDAYYSPDADCCAYMIVNYTSSANEAIRDLKWLKLSDDAAAAKAAYTALSNGKVTTFSTYSGDAQYTLASNLVKTNSGYYVLMKSSNSYTDNPIMDIDISSIALKEDYQTVCDAAYTEEKADPNDTSEDPVTAFRAKNTGNVLNTGMLIKVKRVSGKVKNYLTNVHFYKADNQEESMKGLWQYNASNCVDDNVCYSVNNPNGYVAAGYSYTTDVSDTNVVTGIKARAFATNETVPDSFTEEWTDPETDEKITLEFQLASNNVGEKDAPTYVYVTTTKGPAPVTGIATANTIRSSAEIAEDYLSSTLWDDAIRLNGYSSTDIYLRRSPDYTVNRTNNFSTTFTLTINTVGNMDRYGITKSMTLKDGSVVTATTVAPWYGEEKIAKIIVCKYTTAIRDHAFDGFDKLKSVCILNPDCAIRKGVIPEGVTIYCIPHSSVQKFAEENGYTFKPYVTASGTIRKVKWTLSVDYLNVTGTGAFSKTAVEVPALKNAVKAYFDEGITSIDAGLLSDQLTEITILNDNCEIAEGAIPEGCNIIASKNSKAAQYAATHNCLLNGKKAAGGTTAAGIRWSVLSNTLTLSGSGAMDDYSAENMPEWSAYADQITNIVMKEGITAIGSCAFRNLGTIESAAIPSTVTAIGRQAFDGDQLTVLDIPEGVVSVDMTESEGTLETLYVHNPDINYYDNQTCGSLFASVKTIYGPKIYQSTAEKLGCTFVETDINVDTRVSYTDLQDPATGRVVQHTTLTLYIKGKAAMDDYTSGSETPWAKYKDSYDAIEVVIDSGVASIGAYAFEGWSNLTKVTVSDTVTSIGKNAFADCSSLAVISFANGDVDLTGSGIGENTTIECDPGTQAYEYARKHSRTGTDYELKELDDGTYELHVYNMTEDYVYAGCPYNGGSFDTATAAPWVNSLEKISKIVVEEGVTRISNYAFAYIDHLNGKDAVTLPESLTEIGANAFLGVHYEYNIEELDADGLMSITMNIPANVAKIGTDCFFDSDIRKIVLNNADCQLDGDIGIAAANITVPGSSEPEPEPTAEPAEEEDTEGITYHLDKNSDFYALDVISCGTDGKIPDYSKESPSLFTRKGLTDVTVINIYGSISSIGSYAFYNFNQVQGVSFVQSGLTSIGAYSFAGCASLFEITLPSTLKSIGEHAFDGCSSLTSITIPASVASIGEDAFANCPNLQTITIENDSCQLPEDIGLSTDCEIVCNAGSTAERYKSAHSRTADDGNYSYVIDGTVLTINGVCDPVDYTETTCSLRPWNSSSEVITELNFGDGNNPYVSAYEFCGMSSLATVNLSGSSIEKLGDHAFVNCTALESIVIPQNVREIGEGCFEGCTNLRTIRFENEEIELAEDIGLNENVVIESYSECTAADYADAHWLESVDVYPEDTRYGEIFYSVDPVDDQEVLTVTVSGRMPDYSADNPAPWAAYAETANKIIIKEADHIGDYAFADFVNVSSVELVNPDDQSCYVESIGKHAFANCYSLREIVLPQSVKKIDAGCFEGSINLESLTVENYDCSFICNIGIDSNTAITCAENSNAQRYAQKYGIGVMLDDSLNPAATFVVKGSAGLAAGIAAILAAIGVLLMILKKKYHKTGLDC